jgi:hypothetical protein
MPNAAAGRDRDRQKERKRRRRLLLYNVGTTTLRALMIMS